MTYKQYLKHSGSSKQVFEVITQYDPEVEHLSIISNLGDGNLTTRKFNMFNARGVPRGCRGFELTDTLRGRGRGGILQDIFFVGINCGWCLFEASILLNKI